MSGSGKTTMVKAGGITLEVERRGAGRPLLLLTGEEQLELEAPFVDALAKTFEVIIPSPPGFGLSERPDWMTNPDDLAYVMLDLVDTLGLKDVTVVGCSLGGWIAAEMATMVPHRIRALVLVAPCGVKLGSREALDIPDIFAMPADAVEKLLYCEPEKHRRSPSDMSDEELTIMLRNREAFALFGWEPYLHNPKLPHRLHRATCPTLFLRGAHDGLISAEYTQGYADLFPDARVLTLPGTAHLPQIEQPELFADAVLAFLKGEA
jgi:pimeloyl-ACP methyl ester carboxylesterase